MYRVELKCNSKPNSTHNELTRFKSVRYNAAAPVSGNVVLVYTIYILWQVYNHLEYLYNQFQVKFTVYVAAKHITVVHLSV